MSSSTSTDEVVGPSPGKPEPDEDRFAPDNRRRLTGPGLRTFERIADLWSLDQRQRLLVLGLPSRSTYGRWTKAAREDRDLVLSVDVLTRISAILGIHAALGTLHRDQEEAVAWLRAPNTMPPFGDRTPIALVTDGTLDSLLAVRRHLDAAAAGHPVDGPGGSPLGDRVRDEDIVFS